MTWNKSEWVKSEEDNKLLYLRTDKIVGLVKVTTGEGIGEYKLLLLVDNQSPLQAEGTLEDWKGRLGISCDD